MNGAGRNLKESVENTGADGGSTGSIIDGNTTVETPSNPSNNNEGTTTPSSTTLEIDYIRYCAGAEFYPFIYNSEYTYKITLMGEKDEETDVAKRLACAEFSFEY